MRPSFFVRFIHNVIRKVRGGGGQRRRRGGGEDEGGSPRTTWYKGSQVREGDGGHDVGHDVGHDDSHVDIDSFDGGGVDVEVSLL